MPRKWGQKGAHLSQYAFPENPYLLSFQFIFERIEMYLKDSDEFGYCIYDQNERLEQDLQKHANWLLTEGSSGIYYSQLWNDVVEFSLPIQRIIELSFGSSANSIGLQVADFFSSMTNSYYKSGKPENCGWWNLLTESLHRKSERLLGIGLKEFP